MKETERLEDLLVNAANVHKSKIGIITINDNKKRSFNQWVLDARKFSKWFFEKTGDSPSNILLIAQNSYLYTCALFGGFMAGKTIVPIYPKTYKKTIELIIAESKPAVVCCDDEWYKRYYQDVSDVIPEIFSFESIWDEVSGTQDDEITERVPLKKIKQHNEIALIIYTSGTTSQPKGVICPHKQILLAIKAINHSLSNTSEDIILCGLSFSFDYGLYQLFLIAERCAMIVLATDYSIPQMIPQWIDKYQITGLPGVPSLFKILLECNLIIPSLYKSLRYMCSTGDVLQPQVIDELVMKLPDCQVFPMYGLTECKRVSILHPNEYIGREMSVGRPLPGLNAMIVDENSNPLPRGEVGELLIEGQHVMAGYYNKPTKCKRFRYDPETGTIVLFSGDYFKMDHDGFLFFEGRKERFLKVRGKRISPKSLEDLLLKIPGIKETIVIGIPDSIEGETPFIFVVPKKNANISESQIAGEIKSILTVPVSSKRVVIYKRSLPLTRNGKLDREVLKKIAISVDKKNHD